MFCPKCGSILMPKIDKGKKVIGCSCGYKEKEKMSIHLSEKQHEEKEMVVIENEQDDELLPKTKTECEECGNKEAFYWTIQTRAGDEPETKFLKCCKCKHVWRDYN